ncbi:hypothetical protein [Shewanella sp. OMA3-2]|uniref:hypothetical protein n=1 Tax=Shewanella sp. OMA3-2 TaxID=2908650 RepID=UPI001F3BB1B3|nr:hypothetical protein [Shewanella sp. OMA3-2]UJF22359.1 hypothetical protein L0B17_02725 [Shewanella sp. OMA3-2]
MAGILISSSVSELSASEFTLDMAWDSEYISEGRNNLNKGGIAWGVASVHQDDLVVFAALGRGDQTHYIEWNFGVEYTLHLHAQLEATIGYQRLEFYGDERASDNELFSSLTYTLVNWLLPTVSYTYATEAAGYFVEVSLHSPWDITEQLSVTPYMLQGFDFQYVTEQHDGANHIQFGVEAGYALSNNVKLSMHISRTKALEDIKREASVDGVTGSLNQTYAGVHINWAF